MEWNKVWCLGSTNYIRLYPNPGFSIPFFFNKRIKWSKFYGWKVERGTVR